MACDRHLLTSSCCLRKLWSSEDLSNWPMTPVYLLMEGSYACAMWMTVFGMLSLKRKFVE